MGGKGKGREELRHGYWGMYASAGAIVLNIKPQYCYIGLIVIYIVKHLMFFFRWSEISRI